MLAPLKFWLKRSALIAGVAAVTLLAWRVYDTELGPPLELWHTVVPHELSAQQIDKADWVQWQAAEQRVFDEVRREVSDKLAVEDTPAINRYQPQSRVYPARFIQDWNRSYVLEPEGVAKGVVVLLHGLTDSPYSLRHIARRYCESGFVAIGIRMPGHGTVPAGLTDADWPDWMAATRLAVREARQQVPAPAPLHLVGFSNGGALAVKYALDSLSDPQLARADQLILISPMIGVNSFARYAGLAGLPAVLPAFSKAAWLGRLPEFNPFKYNSFPVNGARQSWLLTDALQSQLLLLSKQDALRDLPPILAFQSLMDHTVSTPAVVNGLFRLLPDNGSELVLFDINRSRDFGGLLTPAASASIEQMLPPPPRNYQTSLVTNLSAESSEMVVRNTPARSEIATQTPLGLDYPKDIYSLSHVALPFPQSDALYGQQPDKDEDFGVHLGTLAARGERGVLMVPMDTLMRVTSNPFYGYLLERIEQDIKRGTQVKDAGN